MRNINWIARECTKVIKDWNKHMQPTPDSETCDYDAWRVEIIMEEVYVTFIFFMFVDIAHYSTETQAPL